MSPNQFCSFSSPIELTRLCSSKVVLALSLFSNDLSFTKLAEKTVVIDWGTITLASVVSQRWRMSRRYKVGKLIRNGQKQTSEELLRVCLNRNLFFYFCHSTLSSSMLSMKQVYTLPASSVNCRDSVVDGLRVANHAKSHESLKVYVPKRVTEFEFKGEARFHRNKKKST